MPRNEIVPVTKNTLTELTAGDITSLTFQVRKGDVELRRAADATAAATVVGVTIPVGYFALNVALADLLPGAAGARLFAYSTTGAAVFVSHG